jgi:integrase
MARTVKDSNLETRTARTRLAARQEPYWRGIDSGTHIGYYRGARGGSWLARLHLDGAYRKTTLGAADDITDADGVAVLSYGQALAAARNWFAQQHREAAGIEERKAGPYTVRDAIEEYLADYQRRGGKAQTTAQTAADAHILPPLGGITVSKLTAMRLRDWHQKLAETAPRLRSRDGAAGPKHRSIDPKDPDATRRRRATANRIMTLLKAALNHAFREGHVPSDEAWRRVKPFREADAARIRYLSHDEARRLVNASDPAFRPMIQAALLTGCRYGELAAVRVADLDPEAGTLAIRASKSGKARHVVITDDGITLFTRLAAGKPGDALLIPRPDDLPWGKSHAQRPLLAACAAARISPAASFHVLRHTYASHLVAAGAPLQVVASNLGHADTRMTEKHYAHLAPSYVASVIRATLPRLGIVC